jgi:hypothetical protein
MLICIVIEARSDAKSMRSVQPQEQAGKHACAVTFSRQHVIGISDQLRTADNFDTSFNNIYTSGCVIPKLADQCTYN